MTGTVSERPLVDEAVFDVAVEALKKAGYTFDPKNFNDARPLNTVNDSHTIAWNLLYELPAGNPEGTVSPLRMSVLLFCIPPKVDDEVPTEHTQHTWNFKHVVISYHPGKTIEFFADKSGQLYRRPSAA